MPGDQEDDHLPRFRRLLNDIARLSEYDEEEDPPYDPSEEGGYSDSAESNGEGELETGYSDYEAMDTEHDTFEEGIGVEVSAANEQPTSVTEVDEEGSNSDVEILEEIAGRLTEGTVAGPSTSRIETGGAVIEYETDCLICYDSWQDEGVHQACSLACGHTFGRLCIEKWIRSHKKATCPKCKKRCKMTDIRPIYPKRVAILDKALQQEVESLKDEIKQLELELKQKDVLLDEARKEMEHLHHMKGHTSWDVGTMTEYDRGECTFSGEGYGPSTMAKNFKFVMKQEFNVHGARVFDIDASSQIMLLARRLPGGECVLVKASLVSTNEFALIPLPANFKTVRDLSMSSVNNMALLALSGLKLSIVCWESSNIVLTCNLPAPAWSCSWDLESPHYVYTGLQNGMLMVFDLRQTRAPICSLNGPTAHPIHSLHSLASNERCNLTCGARTLLSASAAGPCHWDIDSCGESSSFPIACDDGQGVCISLAYCRQTDDIVATFRPRVHVSDLYSSQISTPPGSSVLGSLAHIKRLASKVYSNVTSVPSSVNETRMPKSAIIEMEQGGSLFAHGNEVACGVCVRELPTLQPVLNLTSHEHPILDVKFSSSRNSSLLGCISEDKAQVFSVHH